VADEGRVQSNEPTGLQAMNRLIPAPSIEYVVVIDGMVNVAYRHRSDARLRALMVEKGREVRIHKREVGTGRWLDTPPRPMPDKSGRVLSPAHLCGADERAPWDEPFIVMTDDGSHECETAGACDLPTAWYVEIVGCEGEGEPPDLSPSRYACMSHVGEAMREMLALTEPARRKS
jgi:hypothetical protein